MKNIIFLSALLIMSLPIIYGMDDGNASQPSSSQVKSDDALTQKLLDAIYDEDSTRVNKALKAGAQPNRAHRVWDEFDGSPFLSCNDHPMAAAYLSGNLDIIKFLEKNGGVLQDSEDESGGDTRKYKTGVIEQLTMGGGPKNSLSLLERLKKKCNDIEG